MLCNFSKYCSEQIDERIPLFSRRYSNANENGGANLKRSAINNSLLDLTEGHGLISGYAAGQDKPTRRGSVGSLGNFQFAQFESSL